jgi:hypothetical protein
MWLDVGSLKSLRPSGQRRAAEEQLGSLFLKCAKENNAVDKAGLQQMAVESNLLDKRTTSNGIDLVFQKVKVGKSRRRLLEPPPPPVPVEGPSVPTAVGPRAVKQRIRGRAAGSGARARERSIT